MNMIDDIYHREMPEFFRSITIVYPERSPSWRVGRRPTPKLRRGESDEQAAAAAAAAVLIPPGESQTKPREARGKQLRAAKESYPPNSRNSWCLSKGRKGGRVMETMIAEKKTRTGREREREGRERGSGRTKPGRQGDIQKGEWGGRGRSQRPSASDGRR